MVNKLQMQDLKEDKKKKKMCKIITEDLYFSKSFIFIQLLQALNQLQVGDSWIDGPRTPDMVFWIEAFPSRDQVLSKHKFFQ